MSQAIEKRESAVSQWDNREMVDTLKATVCKGATDAQFRMFLEVCKATGLNPFLKEIWFVPSVGVMAGRDGYLRVANEHPQFDGMETRVERDDKGTPIKATCSVWRKDRNHPITCEAYFNEYRKAGNVWQTYPSAMISKVAEVLALKRSFAINGIVTEDEIGTSEERGSREAQSEVAERRIAELRQIPAGSTVSPAEIADLQPEDMNYEQRHAKRVKEANEVLESTPPAPKRNRGTISFEALKQFKTMKDDLRAASGTDELYYKALEAAGVAHADELSTDAGRKVWKAMAQLLNECKSRHTLQQEIEAHWKRIGDERFIATLGANGFDSLDVFLNDANGAQTQAFLRDLEAIQ